MASKAGLMHSAINVALTKAVQQLRNRLLILIGHIMKKGNLLMFMSPAFPGREGAATPDCFLPKSFSLV